MPEHHPYESPDDRPLQQVEATVNRTKVDGLWRDGQLLVMNKNLQLPDRCVKSNQPCQKHIKQNLAWHPPVIFFAILAGVIPYLLFALVLTKRATINIGLSEEWLARRRKRIAASWIMILSGLAIIALPITLQCDPLIIGIVAPVGALILLAGLFYALFATRLVAPKQITDQYVWLKGVHPDYLADLPTVPRGLDRIVSQKLLSRKLSL